MAAGTKGNKFKCKWQHPYIRLAALIVKQALIDYRDNNNREDCIEFFNSDSYVFDILEYGKLEKKLIFGWLKHCRKNEEKDLCESLESRLNRVKEQPREKGKFKKLEENSLLIRKARISAHKKEHLPFVAKNEPFVFES